MGLWNRSQIAARCEEGLRSSRHWELRADPHDGSGLAAAFLCLVHAEGSAAHVLAIEAADRFVGSRLIVHLNDLSLPRITVPEPRGPTTCEISFRIPLPSELDGVRFIDIAVACSNWIVERHPIRGSDGLVKGHVSRLASFRLKSVSLVSH